MAHWRGLPGAWTIRRAVHRESRGLGLSSTNGGFSKGLSCGVRIHTNRTGVVNAWRGPGLVRLLARMAYRPRLVVLNMSIWAGAHVYRMTGTSTRRVCLR